MLEGCRVAMSAPVHRAVQTLVGVEVKVGQRKRECQGGWELEGAAVFQWQILTPSHPTVLQYKGGFLHKPSGAISHDPSFTLPHFMDSLAPS